MLLTKNFFCLMLGVFIIHLNLFFLFHRLMAQTNTLHLGIYNYDVGGAEHTLDEPNEITNIDGLHLNYLSEMSLGAQPGMIDFCNSRNGAIRTALSHDDPTGGYYYPVYDYNPYAYNTMLWRYISDNEFQHIEMNKVETFIDRVYNRYQTNHIGVGAIRVAHQGRMDQQDHFDFIRRAGHRIQQLFGDDVQSMVTHNIFHWDGGTSLADFFSYMGDSLDIYQHEEYPFHVHNAGPDPLHPDAYAPFCGWDYQDWQIDTLILGSYEITRKELIKGQGQNPHTRLEVIIQTQRDYYPATQTFVRRPTESEIWLQAFLALSRGYKGIYSYVYRTVQDGNSWGLIDESSPRQQYVDELCYYQNIPNNYNCNPYAVVAELYEHLNSLGPQIMPLNVNEAFTWKGTAHQYIQEITGDVLDGDHRTIEVAIFNPVVNGQTFDYFMLVNRYCSSDNNGTAAPPQTLTVRINKTGQYQIRDLYTGELFVSSDGYFRNITIGPGRGRVFELRQMFVSNETWETDAVNVSSSITLPSGKTLNISSNSIIKFYSDTELKVQGTLVANGVTFTAAVANANPGYWSRIYFYYANSSSRIQQSTIEKANYGIFCDHASPTLDFNLVKLNVYGIYCQSSSNPYINENYITNNSSYGIYLTQKCNPYIRHNAIQYNGSKGILCLNSSSPNLIGKSSSEPYGANKITENNDHGVSAETNSKPNLGAVTKGSSQGYNDIYSNADKQVSNYTARRVTIYAKKNWWGTAKPGSGLFYGSVNYSSPLSAPSPYAGPTWGIDNSTPSPIVADDNYADEAEKYLDQGQIFEGDEKYEEAVTAYRCVVDNFGESEHSPTAFSRLMACRDKQGDITVESKYVASLTKKGNTDEISSSALLWEPLIEAQAKKYEHALNMCDQLIKKYADDDLARDAWFEKGSIQLFEMSDIEAAKQTLAEFAQTYPEDPLVEHIAVIISSYTLPSMKLPKPTVPNDNQQHDLVIPEKFTLLQNYPNPFNPETEIPYQLPAATHINLTIYNLLGQKIRSLVDKEQEAGFHSVHWDGNDENGTSVASGVYLYAICVDEFKKVKKMLLVR